MDIVGHKKILNFLNKSMESRKVSHAYLFYGPENLGKKMVAEYFACLLLNLRTEESSKLAIHQDFVSLSPLPEKKNISIEQIKNLQQALFTRPFLGNFKVAIIEAAEKMSLEAANSFLKFLEEPPPHAVLILITSKIKRLPKTIISRCQLIKFNPVPVKEVKNFLIQNYQFDEKKAENFARISFGRPGLVKQFLDNNNFLAFQIMTQKVFSLFGGKFFERLEFLNEDSDFFLNIFEIVARDILLSHYELLPKLFFCQTEIKKSALVVSQKKLVELLEKLFLTKKYFNANINKKLALENLLLNI